MRLPVKWRLLFLGAAICALGIVIGWSARATWRQVTLLQERFSAIQLESFTIADHIQFSIEELNRIWLTFRLARDELEQEREWRRFREKSTELREWIEEHRPSLRTGRERELLGRITSAYRVYLAAAQEMGEVFRHSTEEGDPSEELEKVQSESLRVINLAYRLADAHREAMGKMLGEFRQSLVLLQRFIFGALFLLLAMGAWLSVIVYREMIAPLHVKLVETHALMERQEKLAALGGLAAGVAHEIRNPLTAIKAMLFTQQKSLAQGTRVYEDGLIIGNEINRLEEIIKQFTSLANPSEPRLMTLPPEQPLREVAELMQAQLEQAGIHLKVEVLTETLIEVDPQQIKQVLINLVKNAAESIGDHGTVTLRARDEVRRFGGHGTPMVILEVQDTGSGILPEVQKRLFDPFFTTKDTGTGLGLSIAARIVQKHRGSLEFKTATHHGTTFGIVLPVAQKSV